MNRENVIPLLSTIASQTEKKDAYTLTADNGDVIEVDKLKNGRRTIAIGSGKPVVCRPITTQYLPDYPANENNKFR